MSTSPGAARPIHLCVVVRTYKAEQPAALAALLASLISAHDGRGKNCSISLSADVLPTDPADEPNAEATYKSIIGLAQQPAFAPRPEFRVRAHRRSNRTQLERYWQTRCGRRPIGTCGPAMDCGYLETDLTLSHVLARGQHHARHAEGALRHHHLRSAMETTRHTNASRTRLSNGSTLTTTDVSSSSYSSAGGGEGGTSATSSAHRDCDYVLVTNGDNLYARSLFHHTCPHMQRGAGLIGYYFSSHYAYPHAYVAVGKVERSGPDVLFKTRLSKSWVDLGAVLMRADLLRSHPDQSPGYHFVDCGAWRESDGRYIQRISKEASKVNASRVVLDRILYLHQ